MTQEALTNQQYINVSMFRVSVPRRAGPGRRVERFNFSSKSFSCGMICRRPVFKDLMQHIDTRARCSLPAGGAVHPTQDFPV
jgi:hypothetical protein